MKMWQVCRHVLSCLCPVLLQSSKKAGVKDQCKAVITMLQGDFLRYHSRGMLYGTIYVRTLLTSN